MTANTTDVYSGNVRPDDSDEIDLRRYLLVLVKWWREILVITILAGVVTGAVVLLLNANEPPVYSADADILIARLLSNIELDERVSTSSGSEQSDQSGWRASLLQLVKGSEVASAVFAELQDELPATLQSPSALLRAIDASVPLSSDQRVSSNIIRISAETSDPEISAKIANSWAHHLVDYINGLYGEVPESVITNVISERDRSLLAYQAAEKEYVEFVANNQISSLSRQIQEKATVRDGIMLNYTRLLTSVVTTEYYARVNLYNALVTAPANHAAALARAQSLGNVEALDSLYRLHASAVAQLNQARLMEGSLVDGGEAAAKSNAVALQLLKLATFATLHNDESAPALVSPSMSTEVVEMTLDEQLTDVRALVTVLEAYIAQLEGDIQQAAESSMMGADLAAIGGIDNPNLAVAATGVTSQSAGVADAYTQLMIPGGVLDQAPVDIGSTVNDAHEQLLASLESEIGLLRAAYAAEDAKQRQLIHERDLAWTTYDAVGNKVLELSLLRSSANSEVRVGNRALVPAIPQPQISLALPVVAVTMLAFVFAVILALVVDSMGGAPFFSRASSRTVLSNP